MPSSVRGPSGPFLLQRHAVDAADIDVVERAGDRVEAGRIDDHIELVISVGGPDAVRRDALDRRFVQIDEFDVRLVVDLEIAAFQRHPARAKAVIFGDQLLRDRRSLTRSRILRARQSDISLLASRSIRTSRKLPIQMPKPGSP